MYRNRLLHKPVEQLAAMTGRAPVEPERELVQVIIQMLEADRSLVCAEPLVSGYKSNSCHWLPLSTSSSLEPTSETAIDMGVFSKSVMLRICRSL
jgi:hypothetical protein